MMAKNPKSAFPLFQLFRKADLFTLDDLMGILLAIQDTDNALKSTGSDPKLLLERVIFKICGLQPVKEKPKAV